MGVAWVSAPTNSSLFLWAVAGVYIVDALAPFVQSLRGPRWRQAYAAANRQAFSDIPGLLPNSATERAAWMLVSLTAGVCEELLFRGFLIRFLRQSGLEVPLVAALMVSSLIVGWRTSTGASRASSERRSPGWSSV